MMLGIDAMQGTRPSEKKNSGSRFFFLYFKPRLRPTITVYLQFYTFKGNSLVLNVSY